MTEQEFKDYYADKLILQYKTQPKARGTISALVSQNGFHVGEHGDIKYIVVGAPTITDGVASNFSSTNYLVCETDFDTQDIQTLEVGVKFTTGSQYNHTYESIFGTARGTFGFYLTNQGNLRVVYLDDFGTHDNLVSSNIQFNTTYWVNLLLKDNQAIVSLSTNGENWQQIIYDGEDQEIIDIDYIMVAASPFSGSLYLNDTYVKINDKLWCGYAFLPTDLPDTIIEGYNLDTAKGIQLDIIGKYVGLKRQVRALIGTTNTNVLNDEQYRLLLKLKLVQNTNYSSTSQIRVALYNLFPTSIRLFDRRNMTYEYELSTDWNELVNVIIAEQLLPSPMGIGVNVVSVEDLLNLYGYSDYGGLNDNPNGYSSYSDGWRGRYLSYGDKA